MTVVSNQVPCPSNASTLVVDVSNAGAGSSTYGLKARSVAVINQSAQGIYIGGPGVTSATGMLLPPNMTAPITLALMPNDALYARGASSTPTLQYVVTGS